MKTTTLTISLILFSLFSFSQWVPIFSGTTKHLSSICFPEASTGYIAGLNGTILKSIDGGTTWTTLFSGTSIGFSSVFFTDSNTGYVVGDQGTILKTTNGGSTWTTLMSGSDNGFNSVFFIDNNTGYVVGYNYDNNNQGVIFKTINGGTTWTNILVGSSDFLASVFFVDANIGYTVGDGFYKTINGGSTWVSISCGSCDGIMTSVYFTDVNTGYVVGDSQLYDLGTISKTTDGGATWTMEYCYTNNYLVSVYFPEPNIGYAVGITGNIIKTNNGGATWIPLFNTSYIGFNSVYFTDSNTGFVVGPNGSILKTTNGGLLLISSPTDTTVTSNSGYIQYLVTANTNWSATCDAPWCSLDPPSSGSGNGSFTANFTENSESSQRIAKIMIHAADQDSIQITLTQNQSNSGTTFIVKDDFQLYPNPSNGLFKIVPNFENNIPIEVAVFDNIGKKIFLQKFQDTKEYVIDLHNMPQGFYFIILKYNEQTMIQKLIITMYP